MAGDQTQFNPDTDHPTTTRRLLLCLDQEGRSM